MESRIVPEHFDPYHRWLAVPPKDQPPNHYRLLGLELFENDPDVIADAAEQRMAHVRNYQLGKYMALSQRILNELAAAKVCLLNPQEKAEYDQTLRAKLTPPPPLPNTMQPRETPTVEEQSNILDFPRTHKKPMPSWMLWALGGVGCLVVGILLMVIANSGRVEQEVAKAPAASIPPPSPPKAEPRRRPQRPNLT